MPEMGDERFPVPLHVYNLVAQFNNKPFYFLL